jgi:ubiquinone/menaquinone biosynthesis C-methylase UbiE
MSDSDVARQRDYYWATAATYHERHVGEQDEHGLALAVLMALARHGGVSSSFLDVGAGTGRAMQALAQAFPKARVEGIEPVAELQEQALRIHGIDASRLCEGDALHLPFADDSFDWVVETWMLHHIRDWKRAVAQMARVARNGVLISNNNNIGQGSPNARTLKKFVKKLGLWTTFVRVQPKGMIGTFAFVQVMNTKGSGVAILLRSATHVAIVARGQAA